MRIPSKTLLKSAGATAFSIAALAPASAAAPVRISTDPYHGTGSGQHATEVEPDSFAFGHTLVAAFQVGRYPDGGAANGGWATSTFHCCVKPRIAKTISANWTGTRIAVRRPRKLGGRPGLS